LPLDRKTDILTRKNISKLNNWLGIVFLKTLCKHMVMLCFSTNKRKLHTGPLSHLSYESTTSLSNKTFLWECFTFI